MARRDEGEFSEVIACLARKRPSRVSIHECSTEILEMVFSCLVESSSHSVNGWDWTSVLRVCKLWHSVAMNNLSLWSQVDSFRRRRRVEAFLDRSANVGLSVCYQENDIREAIEDVQNLQLALRKMHRICNLTLASSIVIWCEVKDQLATAAPRLRELDLTVSSVSHHPQILSLAVSGEYMPELRVLRLSGLSLIPPTYPLQKLKILELRNTRSSGLMDKDFTLNNLFRILDNCPALEELHVNTIGYLDNTLLQYTVTLPLLRRLTIAEVHFDVCSRMFDYISLPDGLAWNISCTNFPLKRSTNIFPKLLGRYCQIGLLKIAVDGSSLKITEHMRSNSELTENALSLGLNSAKSNSAQELYHSIMSLLKCNRWRDSRKVAIKHECNGDIDFLKCMGEAQNAFLLPQRFLV